MHYFQATMTNHRSDKKVFDGSSFQQSESAVQVQPATPPATPHHRPTPAPYAPGKYRRDTDAQRNAVESFVARHPQYARLPDDVILQIAETYRDDREHALEQDLRDNRVLSGCRADYRRPAGGDWDGVLSSDDAFPGDDDHDDQE